MVSTLAPQAGNAGSNPAGGTKKTTQTCCLFFNIINVPNIKLKLFFIGWQI